MKRWQKLLAFVLAFSVGCGLCIGLMGMISIGEDIIEISTAEDLRKIGTDEVYYPLDGNYVLTADIDLSDGEWDAIENFAGTFDGQGHVISGMYAGTATTPTTQPNWGLFSEVYDSITVKNVIFENVYYNGAPGRGSQSGVGTIVGYLRPDNGTQTVVIENVAVLSGSLYCVERQNRVGGFVGMCQHKANSTVLIKNCYNGATVSGATTTSGDVNRYLSIGGMVGYLLNQGTTISNCINVGQIVSEVALQSGTNISSCGSIAGRASTSSSPITSLPGSSQIVNCYGLEGCVSYTADDAIYYEADKNSVTLLSAQNIDDAAKYAASFTAGWTLKDGHYPLPATLNPAYAVPVGTQGTVISIETEEELRKIGTNGMYPLAAGVYYRLMNDLDFADVEWTPLGVNLPTFDYNRAFSGVFDGNGHTIANLHSGTEAAPVENAADSFWGFFGILLDGTVRNVFFKDVDFNVCAKNWTVGETKYTADFAIGAVTGFIKGTSLIENVAVTGTIRSLNNDHQVGVGGIAGGFTGNAGYVIRNCFNAANLSVSTKRSDNGSYAIAAGIIGRPKNAAGNTVENCLNVGKISTASTSTSKTAYCMPGHIVTLQGMTVSGGTAMVDGFVFNNNYGISGTLSHSGTYSSIYQWDTDHTNVVDLFDVDDPASFAGLTAGENSLWTVKASTTQEGISTYYYPMLKTFVEDSVPVELIYIETAEQLRKIGTIAEYPLNGNYKLINNLDLSDKEWVPIEGQFSGRFDGNGKVISGLFIGTKDSPKVCGDSGTYNFGLFELLSGQVEIKDLAFENICINVQANYDYCNVGAVSGYALKDTTLSLKNVAVLSGYISGSAKRQTSVGGVIGRTPDHIGTVVEDCFNAATVVSSYHGTGSCYAAAAGIVGDLKDNDMTVRNCLNVGPIYSLKAGTAGSNVSSVGNIVAVPRVGNSSEGFADGNVLTNSYAISGTLNHLEGIFAGHCPSDLANVTSVKRFSAKNAQLFAGLTSGENSAWTVKASSGNTYYYPMLKTFVDHSVAIDPAADLEALETLLNSIPASNNMTQEYLNSKLDTLMEDYTANLTLVKKATASEPGSWSLALSHAEIGDKNYTLTIEPLPEITYAFRQNLPGSAEGTVTVTLRENYVSGNYSLCWGTADGLLTGYTPIAEVDDLNISGKVLSYTFADRVGIPAGATHLWFAQDGVPVSGYELPSDRKTDLGNLKYTYGVLSDTHFTATKNGAQSVAFATAMNLFESANATFTVVTGDFTNNGAAGAYTEFQRVYTEGGWTMPVFVSAGNHDALEWNIDTAHGLTPEQALENLKNALGGTTYANPNYTGPNGEYKVTVSEKNPDYDYTVQYGDDLFVYMGIGVYNSNFYKDDAKTNTSQHLDPTQLEWLEGVLENYYNTNDVYGNVYLMFHYYTIESGFASIYNKPDGNDKKEIFSGTGYIAFNEWSGPRDGFVPDWNSSDLLYNLLKKYPNVIHFAGHSHRAFSDNESVSVTRKWKAEALEADASLTWKQPYTAVNEPLGYTAVHVPSGQNYEGYLVSVYENGVLLSGYNTFTGEIVANANFFIPNALNDEVRVRIKENTVMRSTTRMIQYVEGYGEWKDLMTVEDLTGDANADVDLQVTDTHIQWKNADSDTWANVIALEDLGKEPVGGETIKSESEDLTVIYNDRQPADKVYLLDISWDGDDFAFDYDAGSQGVWTPSSHTYEGGEEGKWVKKTINVTVVNHSNGAVNVAIGVQNFSDKVTVSADKSALTLPTAEGTPVNDAPTESVTFTADGTPTEAIDKVATVTIALSAADESADQ